MATIPPLFENLVFIALMVAFGLLVFRKWRTLFGDDRKIFERTFWRYGALFGERLDAAIDRRSRAENIDRRVFWAVILAEGLIYVSKLLAWLSKDDAFALIIAVLIAGVAVQALTTTRKGLFNVALLQPRDPMRYVPAWLFVLPAIVWAGGSVLALRSGATIAVGVTLIASLLAFYASYVIARAPSMIGSEDPQMDAIVDAKIRAYRIRFVLLAATLTPLVLTLLVNPTSEFLRIAGVIALLVIAWWSKLQNDFSAGEIATIASSEAT